MVRDLCFEAPDGVFQACRVVAELGGGGFVHRAQLVVGQGWEAGVRGEGAQVASNGPDGERGSAALAEYLIQAAQAAC
ncbi:hypothetical protein [Streptomyces sp. JNUCC 63]